MGRQDGVIPVIGQIGGLSFYKSKRGYQVRRKGGVSADRIKSDPAFQRTRENGNEFARAGRATRLVRSAFRSLILKNADSLMSSRLTREMMKVVQADSVNARGARIVLGPNTKLLEGFEFNELAKLGNTLFARYTAAIDRTKGNLSVTVDPFIPQDMITAPAGATHAWLVAAGAEVNFTEGQFAMNVAQGDRFKLDEQAQKETVFNVALPANSIQPLWLAFGIAFFQEVNGAYYPLKNGAYNSLAIIKINGGE